MIVAPNLAISRMIPRTEIPPGVGVFQQLQGTLLMTPRTLIALMST